jgi:hypothetical protein
MGIFCPEEANWNHCDIASAQVGLPQRRPHGYSGRDIGFEIRKRGRGEEWRETT